MLLPTLLRNGCMWILRLSNIKIKNEDNNSGCESLAAGQRKQSVGNVGRNIEGRNAEERYLLGKDAWIDFIYFNFISIAACFGCYRLRRDEWVCFWFVLSLSLSLTDCDEFFYFCNFELRSTWLQWASPCTTSWQAGQFHIRSLDGCQQTINVESLPEMCFGWAGLWVSLWLWLCDCVTVLSVYVSMIRWLNDRLKPAIV